ncbi:MAG TPA: peptidase T [Candidatus Merdiplasma excrementigallinarum]|uniref:Peptidase T n=1 Tax=Candidatus Merdiplasma excrementigallinarum TaxID=2840864 RepID=A0A9D1NYC4_9FIRM|nr:peptidase T [Candidatus Merdiplasma excrementigallinarum]
MRAYERLLHYVKIYTTSDEESTSVPSTNRQFDLAMALVEEMKELGIEDARVDEHCYVYGSIPATPGYEDKTAIGFIAHLDTAPDYNGEGVKPQVRENYDGGEIALGESGLVLSPDMFPHLKSLKGRTLITTDGTTLLGADDKAGIAEIMTLAQELLKGETPHGKICIGFTPDEEVGGGAELLDIPAFGAEFAYTVDGGCENEIVYENFNACGAAFEIQGVNIHPGEAKDKMVNAALAAAEICGMLPWAETPRHTERYEGFFHLTQIQGTVEHASLHFIIRDHDGGHFEARQEMLRQIEKAVNEKYGAGTAKLTIRQQYRNMEEMVKPCMHLIDYAKESIRELGMEPDVSPVRGGTDGAQLSFRGLPCPNLGTGGYAFHGPYEHITAEGMDRAVQVMLGIVKRYANREK